MSNLFPVSLDDMIEEVDREIRIRQGVYQNLVALGIITQEKADRRIAVMGAVAARLRLNREWEQEVNSERPA